MKRILVVDDSILMRSIIAKIIHKNNLGEVIEAVDGDDAIVKYKLYQPDLVTMDITMPGISGVDTVERIKDIDPLANIIMVTAMGQKAMVVDALKAGARDFIVKPFEEVKLVSRIEQVYEMLSL